MLTLNAFTAMFFDKKANRTLNCPKCGAIDIRHVPTPFHMEDQDRKTVVQLIQLECTACEEKWVYADKPLYQKPKEE